MIPSVPSNNIQQLAHCMHISSRGEAEVTGNGKGTGHLDTMHDMHEAANLLTFDFESKTGLMLIL